MTDKEKAELDAVIGALEHQIMGLGITLSKAGSKLDDLQGEIERLKALRDGKRFELQASLDFAHELPGFIESIPYSVRGRVIKLAQELEETGDALLAKLWQETRSLLLYDAIYDDVDSEYDLPSPMLSRVIRGCVDHSGQVPMGADRDSLLRECPGILDAIESAYQKHAVGQLGT
ncbi:hypothetical protein [Halomonas heilongjiangensis]|uniref:Uncharacterized protein n=1 Tax=Halomonas heilongjiangensis TaxID=1387883 RepID=A0A2N7TUA2_9GAMM|nr:hypothetical protein [Halomonas heilongjiangensis]PMR71728.1 hypothetical protein C1H66_01440 [Halomonas heilongjiangensis]PXX89991.1 hypothetical protein CR158_10440 [Halomonas heilongjiangensis]